MLLVILLVLFILIMAIWGLILGGAISGNDRWLAFIAVLILGTVVFLVGGGVIEVTHEKPAGVVR